MKPGQVTEFDSYEDDILSPVSENIKLHSLSLTGFKAFGRRVSLPVSPITVLAGLNSHGKSSVIDALLLLRQTLLAEKRVTGDILLDWTGPFFNVDRFEEMVYDKKDEVIRIGFRFLCKISEAHTRHQSVVIPRDADAFFVRTDFSFHKPSDSDQVFLKISFYADSGDGEEFLRFHIKKEAVPSSDSWARQKGGYKNPSVAEIIPELPKSPEKSYFPVMDFNHFLPIWKSKTDETPPEHYTIYHDFFQPVVDMIERELLYHITYVGPLREEPERKYFKKQIRGNDVGSKGQDTVLLLQRHWRKHIMFVRLPEDEDEVISWEALTTEEMELGQALNEALRWMGMQKLKVKDTVEVVRADFATLSPEETWVTLADVGFGVSQILPVLTTALLSEPESILIFEQPEIHLHPRSQARLAELIVCFARTGRRVLIETHSDHLINRLRRVAAEDLSDQLAEQVGILFIRQTGESDGAYVDPLRLNAEGLVENWPPGFLAETVEDSRAIVKTFSLMLSPDC